MTIEVDREPSTQTGTIGRLSIDGVFLCYSLEPPGDRPDHPSIPAGTYKVIVTPSLRFRCLLPLIVNVPGRTGVRIHPGNVAQDTEGCILLGTGRQGEVLINSRAACQMFQSKIMLPLAKQETVLLTIKDAA